MRRIGIMGGTFDPIHNGHLFAAEAAGAAFSLESVLFVPSGVPPHKRGRRVTAKAHRYAMVCAATASNSRFTVSRVELDRSGPSFTVDTLASLASEFAEAEFHFITGTDAIAEIFTWKDWPRLLGMCYFAVATRPGVGFEAFRTEAAQWGPAVADLAARHVELFEVPQLEISSTDIRERCASGRPFRYLVPQPVYDYILAQGLYDSPAPTATCPTE